PWRRPARFRVKLYGVRFPSVKDMQKFHTHSSPHVVFFTLSILGPMRDIPAMKMTLAERIQSRIDALGKNPSAVSLEAGLSRSAVRDILSGKVRHSRIDTLKSLTGPLECTLDYLTGETDEPAGQSSAGEYWEYDT